MIHSQTTGCDYETLIVILNPYMTVFQTDLQFVEAPFAFNKILRLKPLTDSPSCSRLADSRSNHWGHAYRFITVLYR